MFGLERLLIFQPGRNVDRTPADVGLRYEDARIQTEDGVRIHGFFVPKENARALLLFFHGNAGTISDRLESIRLLHRHLEHHILIIDYRGYGRSEGRPSEEGLYADARAARQWLKARAREPLPFHYYGRSLGCAVALQLALEAPPERLVLEAPFLSIEAMARRMFPFMRIGPLLRIRFDNGGKIPKLQAPLLIIHGTDDEVVPYDMGKTLFERAPEPRQMLSVPGAHHSDLWLVGGRRWLDTVKSFLCPTPGHGAADHDPTGAPAPSRSEARDVP